MAFSGLHGGVIMDIDKIEELVDKGDFELALEEADKALRLGQRDAELLLERGRALAGLQMFEEAVRDLSEAIRLGLEEPVLFDVRGSVFLELGRHECALKDFDEAIRLGREEARWFWGESAMELLHKGNDPLKYSLAEVHYSRGWTHLELANYGDAIGDFNESIRLVPHEAEYYAKRGEAYHRQGLPDDARKDFRKAEELQ